MQLTWMNPSLLFENVDQLYAAIRKKLILTEFKIPLLSLPVLTRKLVLFLNQEKEMPSDLAYIMFNILQQWDRM